ncbi:hypothetical protein KIH74_17710 [Kineosporia sp. J2-2]|uniref:Mycothiol system anti-sigma-R factor n=1 Tax=Kineosporia corallincola TaxID=2835133 RepID=A0ABS5TMF5_9ACTN|nr:hypothetical protein [Kineosporia corallincola]MBT0770784.1 hypothetical protein [Kineosporia corallincola]
MTLTEQELGDVIDDLHTDFPGLDRNLLDQVVHRCADCAPDGTANQVEQAARMQLHLRHQGDH